MARQLVSRLTFALALTSSMAFVGCAEEPKTEVAPVVVETPKDKEAPAAVVVEPAKTPEAPK